MNLLDETLALLSSHLENNEISVSSVAHQSGVQPRWLHNLAKNKDRGYDVTMVQRVYDYLNGIKESS